MTLDLESVIHRARESLREALAFDDLSARRHTRLRAEATTRGKPFHETRSGFIDAGLDLSERARALQVDVLLVCATKTEFEQLEAAAVARGLAWEAMQGAAGAYYQLGRVGHDRVSVLRLKEMGSHSPDGSAFACHRARAETGATSVIGVGMAFGIDVVRQSIADVLISTSVFLYEDCRVRDDPTTGRLRYDYKKKARVDASERWLDRFRALKNRAWKPSSGASCEMHFGRLLAGSKLIESAAFRDELVRERVPKADVPVVGGEMEAAGIAAACRPPGEWIIVKGICDYATEESRERVPQTREPAARAAAECVLDALAMTGSA
ncbi:MAG: hypothetical protein M5U28_28165 [Sandaracinaceae bacterium]|nr:hypothetical protein [Sandaracinaceae bacterium]